MPYETHLFLRGRVFYLRLTRPIELQRLRRERGLPLKRTTWCSLATSDVWEARKRASDARASGCVWPSKREVWACYRGILSARNAIAKAERPPGAISLPRWRPGAVGQTKE